VCGVLSDGAGCTLFLVPYQHAQSIYEMLQPLRSNRKHLTSWFNGRIILIHQESIMCRPHKAYRVIYMECQQRFS